MSPAGIIGGNGLYVRVVGIGVVLRGENTKKIATIVLSHGRSFRWCGLIARQRVPAAVEFTIYLGAEQCGVSELLPAVLDAVAADAHAFEFVAGGVKHIVKDVGLFVLSDLGGSEIDERCCHRVKDSKTNKIVYIILMCFYPKISRFHSPWRSFGAVQSTKKPVSKVFQSIAKKKRWRKNNLFLLY